MIPGVTIQSFIIIWYQILYRNRLSGSIKKKSLCYQYNFIYLIIVTALTAFTPVLFGFVLGSTDSVDSGFFPQYLRELCQMALRKTEGCEGRPSNTENTTNTNRSNNLQQHCTAKNSEMQMYVLQKNFICYGWFDCYCQIIWQS